MIIFLLESVWLKLRMNAHLIAKQKLLKRKIRKYVNLPGKGNQRNKEGEKMHNYITFLCHSAYYMQ